MQDHPRLLASKTQESSAWLNVFPSKTIGTHYWTIIPLEIVWHFVSVVIFVPTDANVKKF